MNNKKIINQLNATISDAKKEIYSDILKKSNEDEGVSSELDWLKNRFKQHGLDNKVRNESRGVSEEEWNRKVDAFYNFWPKVEEMFAKYGAATDKDYKWSPQREWCIDLSKYLDIMCSFNHMSDSFQIHYAVAYWIMESILKQVKVSFRNTQLTRFHQSSTV